MLRGLMLAATVSAGAMLFAAPAAQAAPAPATPIGQALVGHTMIDKVQARYCRRWYRECRARWGGGPDFRRCLRRRGC